MLKEGVKGILVEAALLCRELTVLIYCLN